MLDDTFVFVDQASDFKRRVTSSFDQVFPEYEQPFSDTFGKSSTELLMNYTLIEGILKVDTKKLVNLLMKASNGKFG